MTPGPARPGPSSTGRGWAVWRGLPRGVWTLVLARAINDVGAYTLTFLTILLTRTLGLSVSAAGVVVAAFGAATVPSRLIGGHAADRVGCRRVVVAGLLATATMQVAVAWAPSVGTAVGAAILLGLSFELYEAPAQALLAGLTPPRDITRAYGLQAAALGVAGIVAGLGATVVGRHDLRLLFVADAASCALGAGVVAVGLRGEAVSRGKPAPATPDRSPWRDPALVAMLLVGTGYACVHLQSVIILPLTVVGRGLPAADVGLLLVTGTVAMIVGQPLLARILPAHTDPFRAMAAGSLLLGVGFVAFGFCRSPGQFAAAAAVVGLGNLVVSGRAFGVVAAMAPERARARYLSVFGLGWGVAATLTPVVGTVTYQHLGPAPAWVGAAGLCLALAAAQPWLRRVVAGRGAVTAT